MSKIKTKTSDDLGKWEKILESEGLGLLSGLNSDINAEVSSIQTKVSKKLQEINFENHFNAIIDEIESTRNCKVQIDYKNKIINIVDNNGILIGEMAPGIIKSDYFQGGSDINHFCMEINEDFHRLGFGTIIFKLYEKLSKKNDNDFYMSGIEYKKKPKPILFCLSHGYRIVSVIKDGIEQELYDEEIEKLIQEFKNPEILSSDVCEYIYRLEKKY